MTSPNQRPANKTLEKKKKVIYILLLLSIVWKLSGDNVDKGTFQHGDKGSVS